MCDVIKQEIFWHLTWDMKGSSWSNWTKTENDDSIDSSMKRNLWKGLKTIQMHSVENIPWFVVQMNYGFIFLIANSEPLMYMCPLL